MRSLSRLQHWLAAVYEINVDYDVMDFLVTDQAVACALQGDNNRPDCPEKLFLQQTSGELGISLYLAPEVITGLATGNAVSSARDAQVFCHAIEGVSHFLYLVWRAGFDRTLTQLELELQAEIDKFIGLLVLAGGMQPSKAGVEFAELSGLPLNEHNFYSGHYQCYPEESQRTGILTGGCARGPMNASQSIESAGRAALKALNFLEGSISIDPTYPIVDQTKCDQCKRCVEECPYACYSFDEKGFPQPDLTKCRQCGNCMGVCPISAISLNHLTIKQLAAQVEVLENSFLDHNSPIILAFLCENDAYVAAKSAMDKGLNVPINVIHIKVPCAGAVNNAVVADALSLGVDGVLIAGCQDGQCHYVRGNELVRKRSGDLGDKLGSMRIEPERVRSVCVEIQEAERYVAILEEYVQDLTTMGPNPFKI